VCARFTPRLLAAAFHRRRLPCRRLVRWALEAAGRFGAWFKDRCARAWVFDLTDYVSRMNSRLPQSVSRHCSTAAGSRIAVSGFAAASGYLSSRR